MKMGTVFFFAVFCQLRVSKCGKLLQRKGERKKQEQTILKNCLYSQIELVGEFYVRAFSLHSVDESTNRMLQLKKVEKINMITDVRGEARPC